VVATAFLEFNHAAGDTLSCLSIRVAPLRVGLILVTVLASVLTRSSADAETLLAVPVDLGIPNAAAPAFSPDGKTVYVGTRKGTDGAIIFKLNRQGAGWSRPLPAIFSDGSHRDLEPVFAPNGRYLVFASNRAPVPQSLDLDGHFNGALQTGKGGALWRVDLVHGNPGNPTRLPDIINSMDSVFSPALTAEGSVYFMRADGGQKFHIFRSQFDAGCFASPTPASFTDDRYSDFDPAVSPDESFVIFSSGRPPAINGSDLFIVFRKGQRWEEPVDLKTTLSPNVAGIEARLSPDARTLYFVNSQAPSGQSEKNARYLWKVDLTPVLRTQGFVDIGRGGV
jgi:Tol biopolymer transport system component